MSRSRILELGVLLSVVTTVPAFAETTPPYASCTKTITPSDSNSAHEKYIAGKQDYDEGNYESAVRRFRDAYTIDCTKHELLIIISAAYERNGQKKEAVTALETYVARAPTAPDVSTYQAKIDNLKKQIAAAAPPPPTAAPPTAAPPRDVQGHTIPPWILVGVGGAAVITGVIVAVTTPDLPAGCDKSQRQCTQFPGESNADFAARQDQAGDAKGQPTVGIVVAASGGALVLGGLLWHFLEPTGPKDMARLRPVVSPSFAGFSLGGRF